MEWSATISHAQRVEIQPFAPVTAKSATIRIAIEPASGSVLVYTPAQPEPIRFNGPSATREVPLQGDAIFVQMILGATAWKIAPVSFKENLKG
jgi:hypothetical protein